jgi:hypothetical protein
MTGNHKRSVDKSLKARSSSQSKQLAASDKRTGQALIEVCQASPQRNFEIAPPRSPAPVRNVDL